MILELGGLDGRLRVGAGILVVLVWHGLGVVATVLEGVVVVVLGIVVLVIKLCMGEGLLEVAAVVADVVGACPVRFPDGDHHVLS